MMENPEGTKRKTSARCGLIRFAVRFYVKFVCMYTGGSLSLWTSSFWLIKFASLCFISAWCAHETVRGCSRYSPLPHFPFGRHCSTSSDVYMFDLCPLLPPRGAGGGDGESRDGGPPRETETPAQTQRALFVPPTGVITCHTHQVHGSTPSWYYTTKWSVSVCQSFFLSPFLSFPHDCLTYHFDSKYPRLWI